MVDDHLAREDGAEAFGLARRLDLWAAYLFPGDLECVRLKRGGQVDGAVSRRQRAVFRRVGGELMQHQRDIRDGLLAEIEIAPRDDRAPRIARRLRRVRLEDRPDEAVQGNMRTKRPGKVGGSGPRELVRPVQGGEPALNGAEALRGA